MKGFKKKMQNAVVTRILPTRENVNVAHVSDKMLITLSMRHKPLEIDRSCFEKSFQERRTINMLKHQVDNKGLAKTIVMDCKIKADRIVLSQLR